MNTFLLFSYEFHSQRLIDHELSIFHKVLADNNSPVEVSGDAPLHHMDLLAKVNEQKNTKYFSRVIVLRLHILKF